MLKKCLPMLWLAMFSCYCMHLSAEEKQYPLLPYSNDYGGSFNLTDHTGKKVSNNDFFGKFVILYFGYSDCPDTCPLALYSISQALRKIEPLSKEITPLFVNLDFERDSLSKLEAYVHYFYPTFIGLTGSDREIAIAAGAYGIRYRRVQNKDGSNRMIHSGKIFLLGPDGKVLTYFPHEASIDWIATVTSDLVEDHISAGVAIHPN